jgi:hypothetical protein
MDEKKFLKITVDKSHIITIGERLYHHSVEFIRELVNNAYDADATVVKVNIKEDEIEISDNGTGMDLEGLKQYFNIGSTFKRIHSKTEKFKRDRIGEFGIGKFATLSACKTFEVYTQCGNFAAKVIFDKDTWEKEGERWELPLEILKPDEKRGDGTTVILKNLKKKFELQEVERCLVESVPIKAENFSVYLNNKKITPKYISGNRYPILEGTKYGIISGEIIILPEVKSFEDKNFGIEVKVKGVTIKRELFGMEILGKDLARIRGEINCDFLPVTSDRSGFIVDSDEYKVFLEVMNKIVEELKKDLQRLSNIKESRKVKSCLKEALLRVQKALFKNPQFSPFGYIPVGEIGKGAGEGAYVPEKRKEKEIEVKERKKREKKLKKEVKPKIKRLTPNAVMRKLKLGETGITCCVDSFGSEAPECFTEGTIIYINRDHPLYIKNLKNKDTHIMNIARLLTQEISLMKNPKNPREAYQWQSKLLKDAFEE